MLSARLRMVDCAYAVSGVIDGGLGLCCQSKIAHGLLNNTDNIRWISPEAMTVLLLSTRIK